MTTVEVFAPAKINLTLHVTGKKDGYHLLDSLVVFAKDIGDEVSVSNAETFSLSVTGPLAAGVPTDESNLVLKAARFMQKWRAPDRFAEISLVKNLPHGAGIGGGSADAGAVLRGLGKLWGTKLFSGHMAFELGSDVPVCLLAPKPCRMTFRGAAWPVRDLPSFWLVLANPGVHVPTAEVFKRFSENFPVENEPMEEMPFPFEFDVLVEWLRRQRNDLTQVMDGFCPSVLVCRDALAGQDGCLKADMSGSGGTCWGIFKTEGEAKLAEANLSASYPDWWVKQTAVEAFRRYYRGA